MSKRQRRGKPNRRSSKWRNRAPASPPAPSDGPDLVNDIAAALDEGPLNLLGLASSLLAALDPPQRGPFEQAPAVPSRDELVGTLFEVEVEETSALLAAIAALCGDDVLRRRVRREIDDRAHALPGWLAELHRACPVERTVEMSHILGDGDNLLAAVRLPGGHELTAVVYIDHNMGTVVKDAFVVPEALPTLIDQFLAAADDPDTIARDLDPADARTRITAAIERGALMYPPFETDSWPACRPFVEWVAGMLPAGGSGYPRPEWDADALVALTEQFFGSRFGAGLDDDHRGLLDSVLWFGTDYGPGDPLRWSPTAVEILLVDWIPRKIVAEAEYLAKAPELLRAFIRFSHDRRGIRTELTEQTLAAVDEHEPQYQRTIRSPRPQGSAALLAAMGLAGDDDDWPTDADDYDDELPDFGDISKLMLDSLQRAVGGEQALEGLDTRPLPDEPFVWEAIPDDVHDRVRAVLGLTERCADEMFDAEFRTACRRFLSRAAAGDPDIFRRRSRNETVAAAVCWVIGKANRYFSRGIRVKDLTAHFGVGQGSPTQRAQPLLTAIGVNPHQQYAGMELGSPDYLTAGYRDTILELRARFRAMGEQG